MAPGAVALEFMWSINLLFYAYSMSSKDIKAKIILLISRFATLENKDFYVQNDYGILAYMCINEVMEYWWLEMGNVCRYQNWIQYPNLSDYHGLI